MRSIVILALAAALFAGFLVRGCVVAGIAADKEAKALPRLRSIARRGTLDEPYEDDGYRFTRIEGDGLPALFVAGPAEPEEYGVRWFATTDGERVYEFDTVLFRARKNRPDPAPLRRFLALDDKARAKAAPPSGWRLLE